MEFFSLCREKLSGRTLVSSGVLRIPLKHCQGRIQGRWSGWIFTPLFLSPLLSFFFLSLKYWNNIWFLWLRWRKFTSHFRACSHSEIILASAEIDSQSQFLPSSISVCIFSFQNMIGQGPKITCNYCLSRRHLNFTLFFLRRFSFILLIQLHWSLGKEWGK